MKRIPKPRTLGIASLLLFALFFFYPMVPSIGGLLFFISMWFSVLLSIVAGIRGSKWWFVVTGMCGVTLGFLLLLGFTAK
jgi:hypothetical protein